VNITKWVILGGGLILLGLFTKEAATKGLTGTLQRTGIAGQSIGTGLSGIGSGIGGIFKGLLTPLWEVGNFAKSFGFASPNISGQGYSTNDPQAIQERTLLSGQGGGFDDASQQGGGDVGINEEPVGDQPNWFNFDPFPQAYGMFDVGGSNIRTSTISWGNGTIAQGIPLSQEARDYYTGLGVKVAPPTTGTTGSGGGGGSNDSTGGGGGFGSTPSTSIGSGRFGSKPASGGWGL
jgi:hypothetical protein